jgi:anthranilate/para-aminobenzoate synthase component II
MHHVMAFASLYIGDSQTMAAEAGVLGIPFIRFNDFVGRISYLDELENKYELGYGIKTNEEEKLFTEVPETFPAGRYHSWIVNKDDLPDELAITSVDEENEIMSLRHKTLDVRGVQFHPESILTEDGKQMIKNWLGV